VAMTGSLSARRYKALMARLAAPVPLTSQGDVVFGEVAAQLLAPVLKSVLRAVARMHEEPVPDELHRLRKRAKRTRYALEMMLAINHRQLGDLFASLEKLQDLLGGYHDAVVAIGWVREFVTAREQPSNITFACGALAEEIRRREQKLRRRGLKEVHRFVKSDPERAVKKALQKAPPKEVSSDAAVHHAPRPGRRARA
jgi:hypothetical protein